MSTTAKRFIFVLAIPLVILISARVLQKPYLYNNVDPDYYYLINALHLSQGYTTEYCHHPGIPTQVFGGLYIRATHLTWTESATAQDVCLNSSAYLDAINLLLVGMSCLCLALAGWFVLRKYGFLSCLTFQIVPLLTMVCVTSLTGFRTEATIMGLNYLFAAYLLCLNEYSSHHKYSFWILSAVIAFGVASRIVYAPLVTIPIVLFIQDKKKTIYFLAASILLFFAFTFPVSSYKTFARWIYVLTFRKGHAGGGDAGILDINSFLTNLTQIIKTFPFAILVILISFVILFLSRKTSLKSIFTEYSSRLLLCTSMGECLVILMIAKSPTDRYMIPAFSLLGINLVLILEIIRKTKVKRSIYLAGYFLIILLGLTHGLLYYKRNYLQLKELCAAYDKIEELIKSNPKPVVSFYGSSRRVYALKFGCDFSQNKFGELLDKHFPNAVFYNMWHKNFSSFSRQVEIDELPSSFYLEGFDFKAAKFGKLPENTFTSVELFRSNNKAIYEVTKR